MLVGMRRPALIAAALLAACATPKVTPLPMPSAEGSGEISFVPTGSAGTSAAFDQTRVFGPMVNMEASAEGVWGGDLRGQSVVLDVSEGRLRGAGLEMAVEREGDALRLGGLVRSRRVSLRLSPKFLTGTVDGGACSFDMRLASPGVYRGSVSCSPRRSQRLSSVPTATLRLAGDAARVESPVLPQFVLALLAVLPI